MIIVLGPSLATPAAADEGTPPPSLPPPPPPSMRWYGWEGILVDVPSLLMMGALESGPLLPGLGAAGFVFGPPSIHLARGHVGKAAGSLALRLLGLGLPIGIFAWGEVQCRQQPADMCGVGAEVMAGLTAFVTIPVAVLADDLAIAWDRAPPPMVPDASISPWLTPVRGGVVVGARGLRF
jgi:hypothetical protein